MVFASASAPYSSDDVIAAVCIRRRAGASAPPDGVPPLTELVVDAIAGAGPFAARRLGAVLAEARQ